MRLSWRLRGARESISLWKENAEDVFHHHSDLLHELVAACRARLRDGAGRCDCALSPAQRGKCFLSYRCRSTWTEGPAIRCEGGYPSSRIRQRYYARVRRSRE